jgi:hypothetical protein
MRRGGSLAHDRANAIMFPWHLYAQFRALAVSWIALPVDLGDIHAVSMWSSCDLHTLTARPGDRRTRASSMVVVIAGHADERLFTGV